MSGKPNRPGTWASPLPTQCDLCGVTLANQKDEEPTFIDGRIAGRSSWAIMCRLCHGRHGAGTGTGFGQVYRVKDGLKLEG